MKSIKTWAIAHKAISALVIFAVFSGVYGTLKAKNVVADTQYILGTAEKGTIVTSVTGTGTVSASNQIDLKSKTSGQIIYLNSSVGSAVAAGATVAELDSSSAQISLRGAQINLEKVTQPGSDSKTQEDALNDVESTFLDLADVMSGLKKIFDYNTGYLSLQKVSYVDQSAVSYQSIAAKEFDSAELRYESLVSEYQSVSRVSATSSVEHLLSSSYDTAKSAAQALKDTNITIDYILSTKTTDLGGAGASVQANVVSWTTKMNSHLQTLLADRTSIQGNSLDVESAQLDLQVKQNAYNDTFVTAPFSGVLAKLYVKSGDSVSSGTTIATMISRDQVAEISLNEVDAAKVKVGDKATLTLDALDGLSITGVVSELDLIGTVSQGVVNYAAKITFDTSDNRVRSGMSVSAAIITNAKTGVLTVPASAVKTDAQGSYVLLPGTPTPTQAAVTTGLSSDTSTEIVSGLTEGQSVVVRSISATAAKAATAPSATSLFGGGTNRPAGGAAGGTRALGR